MRRLLEGGLLLKGDDSFDLSVKWCHCVKSIFAFCLNMGKYGPEKASYLDTFYAVCGAKRESGIENMKERHLFVLFITKILPIFNHKYNL